MSQNDFSESSQSETKFNAFNPLQYIKEIYSEEISATPGEEAIIQWMLDKVHTVFAEGNDYMHKRI